MNLPHNNTQINCPYCHKLTSYGASYGSTRTEALDAIYNCQPCDAYFYYNEEEELVHTQIYFCIKDKPFYYRILHATNSIEVGELNGNPTLIQAGRIPNWTPQTISQKIADLLIFS